MTVDEVGDDYTKDGTVDLKGNPVRRSQRGRWKACSFVVVYEAFERMAYYGISSNLVIYMTTKLHQGTVKSANNVTNWVGTIFLTPILGAYIADAHLGRYITFVISSAIYFLMARVIVASLRKAHAPMTHDFHEPPLVEYEQKGTFPIQPTSSLRFLDRASLKTGTTNQWSLCTITEVEETKQMLRMLPVMVVTFVPSAMIAQVNTLFVKQGATLNAKVAGNFSIPPASLAAFVTISLLISIVLYDRVFVKVTRKWTGNPRGITLLQRMGIGIIFHITLMIVAFVTERLQIAAVHGLSHQTKVKLPLTIFALLPQFVLMGMADAFLEVAKLEFFYDQAPDGMKSLGTSYSLTSLGIGNFLSSFMLSTVSRITKNRGRGWILNNLNESRLDYYYLFFAVLNFVNFVLFLIVVKFYVYKTEVTDSVVAKEEEVKTEGNGCKEELTN